jgi:Uma2 family endonuclease
MATGILVSEEVYLHTSYEPDCEFEDGVLIERNLGAWEHGELQALIAAYFSRHRQAWGIRVATEARFKIREGKYLIPDVAVVQGETTLRGVITIPPLLWIEILSPDDRPVRVNAKVAQVLAYGAPYVWVIDPDTLESGLHTSGGFIALEDRTLRIPNGPIIVPLDEL